MNRRHTLILLASFSGLVLGWFGARQEKATAPTDIRLVGVVAKIRRELHYLRISPEELQRFGLDYLSHLDDQNLSIHHAKEISRIFLLSSDFFLNDQSESIPVTYLGYYDPYLRGCGNTLARTETE